MNDKENETGSHGELSTNLADLPIEIIFRILEYYPKTEAAIDLGMLSKYLQSVVLTFSRGFIIIKDFNESDDNLTTTVAKSEETNENDKTFPINCGQALNVIKSKEVTDLILDLSVAFESISEETSSYDRNVNLMH